MYRGHWVFCHLGRLVLYTHHSGYSGFWSFPVFDNPVIVYSAVTQGWIHKQQILRGGAKFPGGVHFFNT